MTGVVIAGLGVAQPGDGERLSHAELLYRATRAALDDAGLERDAITAAVTSTYDYVEGRPLSNQFTLDSIGGVMKPCDLRVGDDGLHALAAGVVSALADPGGVVVVGSVLMGRTEHVHETDRGMQEISYEPVYLRPIIAGVPHPEAMGFGLRARQYLDAHGGRDEDLARLVSRRSAMDGAERSIDQILGSPAIGGPLHELHRAPPADLAAAMILSTAPPSGEVRARVRGVGWAAVDGMLGYRNLAEDEASAVAAGDAYSAAGIDDPAAQIDRAEIYNVYGIDEVLATEALGLAPTGAALEHLLDQPSAVNPTGGPQAHGFARGPSSLAHIAWAIQEMRGSSERVLAAQGWTGCLACSSAVAVMEVES
jgi:acetyl-CoA acetyltransferase